MNPIHPHLIVNHLPVVSTGLAIPMAVAGLIFPWRWFRRAAWVLLLVGAIGSIMAVRTGEQAEHAMGDYGLEFPGDLLHTHEDVGEWAQVWCIAVGIVAALALATIPLNRDDKPFVALPFGQAPWYRTGLPIFVVITSCVAMLVLGIAANLGGQLRHPEAHTTAEQFLANGGAAAPDTDDGGRGRGRGRGGD